MPIPQLKAPNRWRNSNFNQKKSSTYSPSIRNRIRHHRTSTRVPSLPGYGYYKKRSSLSKQLFANGLFLILITVLSFVIFGMIYVVWVSRDLPDPNKLIDRTIAESTKIYDRIGETILYEFAGDQKRTIVKLDEIPDYVKWATISAEDRTFYEHHGFNLLAIIRSVVLNPLVGKPIAGGSTLTQQLVKNAILTNERKISRKVKEFILSYRIENKFSKDEILQLYLNEIPYGSTAYGIEAAARRYFGISAKDLNLAQATVLAALPNAPTFYSPYGNNIERLFSRQEWILNSMRDLGYIKENELEQALNFNIEFKEPTESIIAPHFVFYIKELLSKKYGDKSIEQEGLKIYTTLDLYKQEIAERVINERAAKNEKNYNAKNASLVSIDPKTGQILAMVGSRDYFNNNIDGQVNVSTSPRQPGSSLKPLVYAAFFMKGYTPNTILYDVVTNFAPREGESYEPHNYDLKEYGAVTVTKALAGSLNIPAVKALYLTGVKNVTDLAQNFGYKTLKNPDRYGLSLVLGGGEVTLLDHTAAFGVFAREGEYHPLVAILKIEDRKGKVIEEYKEEKKQVLSAKIARYINQILSNNDARAYVFGAQNWLTLKNRPVAAKTGTTNNYHDAWTIGYTPSIVTGVWVGNSNNEAMKRGAAGGVVAAPIWHDYMQLVLGDTPVENFRGEDIEITGKGVLDGQVGGVVIKIDKVSGLLADENTPPELVEEKLFQQPHSILYYVNPADPRGDPPSEGSYDVQFNLWEDAIKNWAEREKIEVEKIPESFDNLHRPELIPTVSINAPENNILITSKNLTTDISTNAPNGVSRVEYYINDYLVNIISSYPFNLNEDISHLNNGKHKLTIRVCDLVDNCWLGSRNFTLSLNDSQRDGSLSLSISAPVNNTVIETDKFPLELKIISFAPAKIKELRFYYIRERDTTPHLITSTTNIKSNEVSSFWAEAPEAGIYFIYAEGISVSNTTKQTQKVKVKIK